MSSYRQIYYHLVFRTKNSQRVLFEDGRSSLFGYIWGIVKEKQSHLYRINGVEDHIHLLTDLHLSIALADFVRDIKTASSSWIKDQGGFPLFNGWGVGYCALTCGYQDKDGIIEYIKNQQSHHKKETFRAEYERLLIESGVDIDYRYFLND
ncbi:IS200/IS605 family transposase [Marinilabilia salmonicolor]|jgi:REP element-mobilizing transposase RayT|uniref:REP element-mobilizing transposase RayT n=1 Tax=Marinilabilia salmonicolor TaxID=989 RepID=A0A2T0XN02_9BACT|nr:IS200/IS605 family transposase [Marinilabilia salmonicolor]PRZ00313.1 REP element-mobilizing transposase RayT [Marinilabilia salmonicolor]RCW38429.1 REP element-mobilizing transposase RayT [Marinilabilia salmonicolor]